MPVPNNPIPMVGYERKPSTSLCAEPMSETDLQREA